MLKKFIFIGVIVVFIVLMIWGYQKYGTFSTKDRVWLVLEEYLKAAKNHDIERVKKLSYQISDVCESLSKRNECDARMDSVYYFGKDLKKSDFKNVWSDSEQIILLTDLKREESETSISLSRAIIYFITDPEGKIKLLKFNDSKGVSMPKEDRSVEEIDAYNQKRMADTDMDGLEDELEECLGFPATCIKTDPQSRDSDRDGFWDGVQAQFY